MAPMPVRKPDDRNSYTVWWVLLSLNGRINREEYWLAHLFLYMISIAYFIWFFNGIFSVSDEEVPNYFIENSVEFWLLVIINSYFSLAIAVKRFHDLNLSGLFVFFYFFFGIFGLIILGAMPGERGDNQYGPEPPRQ